MLLLDFYELRQTLTYTPTHIKRKNKQMKNQIKWNKRDKRKWHSHTQEQEQKEKKKWKK